MVVESAGEHQLMIDYNLGDNVQFVYFDAPVEDDARYATGQPVDIYDDGLYIATYRVIETDNTNIYGKIVIVAKMPLDERNA